jgi:hypothetical protein
MAVVINDFEVVPEPPPAPARAAAPAVAAKDAPDVERLMALLRARDQRVRAY